MLEITFIRHGQVEGNARGAYIGFTNKPLTLNGISQARAMADRLKAVPFDAIYTSPLERAKYTADIIKEANGARLMLYERLKEWNFGIFEDHTIDAIKEKYPSEYKKWNDEWWQYKIPGGESAREAYVRHTGAIESIMKRYPDGGKICVVTHLCTMRNIFTYLLKMKPEQFMSFSIKNATLNKILITDENYAVLTALNT